MDSRRPQANGEQFAHPNAAPKPLRPGNSSSAKQQSEIQAEIFEDERQRISSCCFDKRGDDGLLLQTYITHIRVEEDAAYPSQPPPSNANPQYKKSRVIIVGVKTSGRVQLHKARENDDGSFQIGKTWNMDELKGVKCFTSPDIANASPEQQEKAKNAGVTGFVVEMSKPYFWFSKSQKEKIFFIGSLTKIYRRYTNGKLLELTGFSQQEMDDITRGLSTAQGARPPQGPNQSQSPPLQDPRIPRSRKGSDNAPGASVRTPGLPPGGQRAPSPLRHRNITPNHERNDLQQPTYPPSHDRSPMSNSRSVTPQGMTRRTSQEPLHPSTSREQLRPTRFQTPPMPSPRLRPQPSSQSNIPPSHHTNDPRAQVNRPPEPPRSSDGRSGTPQDDRGISALTSDRWKPNGSSRQAPDRFETPPESVRSTSPANADTRDQDNHSASGTQQALPERRRPPLPDSTVSGAAQPPYARDASASPSKPAALRPLNLGGKRASSPEEQRSVSRPRMPGSFDNASGTAISTPPPSTYPSRPATASGQASATANGDASAVPSTTETSKSHQTSQSQEKQRFSNSLRSRSGTATQEVEKPKGDVVPSPLSPQKPSETTPKEQEARPGLGPMMGKKAEAAAKWRKAATAATAFKPRAGGAGARLFAEKNQNTSNEPDGITGVVPAPKPKPATDETLQSPPPVDSNKVSAPSRREETPSISVASPPASSGGNQVPRPLSSSLTSSHRISTQGEPTTPAPERKKPRSNHYATALSALEIDPYIFGGREIELDELLQDFGWDSSILNAKKLDIFESDVKKEVGRLEAGSWLGHSEHKDDRVAAFERVLDKTIAQCDEMEGLLTLYSVELSTLQQDIAFIEAQSQGLQVQTANQKLLQAELSTLVETVSIDPNQLAILKSTSLNESDGLRNIESTLVLLYRALTTIDPHLVKNPKGTGSHDILSGEYSEMRALRDRKGMYMNEALSFLSRMSSYLDPTFGAALIKTSEAMKHSSTSTSAKTSAHDLARSALWQFSPLMLFAKEINPDAWDSMMRTYQGRVRPIYTDEFRDSIVAWKKTVRKTTEDDDALFTNQEKETDGLSGTARKLTVKRSQTLAKGLRAASGDKKTNHIDRNQDGKLSPFETFSGALDEMVPLLYCEQSFIVDFFHASSLENMDFIDLVMIASPQERRGANLLARKPVEPDRGMAKRVSESMEDIFGFWPKELQNFIDWAITSNELQGIGILASIERALISLSTSTKPNPSQPTSPHEFLVRVLAHSHARLAAHFQKCVDDQIRAIEDTKVKTKKRKGIIAFMRVFPNFTALVENMLLPPSSSSFPWSNPPSLEEEQHLEIRALVNAAYERINKAMFDSLKAIAKETPTTAPHPPSLHGVPVPTTNSTTSSTAQADNPEDKSALNHHILLIENMSHYLAEVSEYPPLPHSTSSTTTTSTIRPSSSSAATATSAAIASTPNPILTHWRARALSDLSEHQTLYISAIIRRPLGKLLDFVESTETLLSSSPSSTTTGAASAKTARPAFSTTASNAGLKLPPSSIPTTHPSHSRAVFKKLLAAYDAKALRKGIDALRARVEKHFSGEGMDDVPSGALIAGKGLGIGGYGAASSSSGAPATAAATASSAKLVAAIMDACEKRYLDLFERTRRIAREVYEDSVEVDVGRAEVAAGFRR